MLKTILSALTAVLISVSSANCSEFINKGANCKIAAARRNFRFEGLRRPRPESGMVLLQQTPIRIGTRPCGRC